MKIIAIATQKGGVGKTTTSIELAYQLSNMGSKVLLVDCDSQYNATILCGGKWEDNVTIYDLLVDPNVNPSEGIQKTQYLDLIPSDPALEDLFENLSLQKSIAMDRLRVQLSKISDYDFCIIDCSPSIGVLLYLSLFAADSVILPVTADILGVTGMGQLKGLINKVQGATGGRPVVEGLLVTRYRGNLITTRKAMPYIVKLAEDLDTHVYHDPIKESAAVGKAQSFSTPVSVAEPYCDTSLDYKSLAKEIQEGRPL